MLKIDQDKGIIYLTRGDDAVIPVTLTDQSGNIYTMKTGDSLIFSVKKAPSKDEELILQIKSSTSKITFSHDDTADLDIGQYSADIQLVTLDGHHFTPFPNLSDETLMKSEKNWKNFWILPEVTR